MDADFGNFRNMMHLNLLSIVPAVSGFIATISALRIALEAQKRENELLKKQTGRKLSIFFGLVKIRY